MYPTEAEAILVCHGALKLFDGLKGGIVRSFCELIEFFFSIYINILHDFSKGYTMPNTKGVHYTMAFLMSVVKGSKQPLKLAFVSDL